MAYWRNNRCNKTRDTYKSVNDNKQYKSSRNKVCCLIKQSLKRQYSETLNENANISASVGKIFKERNSDE